MSHPLLDRWTRDMEFRHELRQAPAAAVKRAGVPMTEAQWDALRALDWSLPDRELHDRLAATFLPEGPRLVRP